MTPSAFGPYQVLRLLGQGGMGRVFEVQDPARPGRRLALKQAFAERLGPAGVERFRREGELLARVRHRHVVPVHALGEAPEGPWLLMDLVEGESLGERLRRLGPFPPAEAVRIAADLAGAVAALHAAGVLHRDLKPGNALLCPDGTPVLIDFGLAWAEDVAPLTRSEVVLGSPGYLSPEQAEGKGAVRLDARTDVYGLGATLFALLSGEAPFRGENLIQVLHRVLEAPPAWPGSPPPPLLRELVERSLAKDPARRPASAAELERLLRALPSADAAARRPRARWIALAAGLLLVAVAVLVWPPQVEPVGPAPAPPAPEPAQPESPTGGIVQVGEYDAARFARADELLAWSGAWLEQLRLEPAGPRRGFRIRLGGPCAVVAVEPGEAPRVSVAFQGDGEQRLQSLVPGQAAPPFGLPTQPLAPWKVTALAHAPDDTVVVATEDRVGFGQVWRFQRDRPDTLMGANLKQSHSLRALAVGPDGALMIAVADRRAPGGAVGRWVLPPRPAGAPAVEVKTAELEYPVPASAPTCLARDAQGAWWVGCEDGSVRRLWEGGDPAPAVWREEGPSGAVAALRFAPDGARAWTLARQGRSRQDQVACWALAPEGWSREWSVRQQGITDLDLSPDGRRLAVCVAGRVEVWEARRRPAGE